MPMKVTGLELRGFTAFEAVDFSFASGINVLIGENGTGKSHVLKALYALLEAVSPRATRDEHGEALRGALDATFMPNQTGRLVRGGGEKATLWLKTDGGETLCELSDRGDVTISDPTSWREAPDALFIPSRDVLAMYEGFVDVYRMKELSFDRTYNDICMALGGVPLRGEAKAAADALTAPLQDLLGGEVELRGNQFYVDLGDGFREAHLIAEGLRKLATLAHLSRTGSIKAGGILLWDEPEANQNPKIITRVADALRMLAAGGVQVFVATHDYLLAHKLSLAAEYEVEPKVDTCFFSLHHERVTEPVEVESGATLAQIQNNILLDEYARYYDLERALYRRAVDRDLDGAPR